MHHAILEATFTNQFLWHDCIWFQFIPGSLIGNTPTLLQVMAWPWNNLTIFWTSNDIYYAYLYIYIYIICVCQSVAMGQHNALSINSYIYKENDWWQWVHMDSLISLISIALKPAEIRLIKALTSARLWPGDDISPHKSGSISIPRKACCLMTPSHSLNRRWLVVMEVMRQFYNKQSRYKPLICVSKMYNQNYCHISRRITS